MSRKARTLRILQNVNFNTEHSENEIQTYAVQDDGSLSLLKENEETSTQIIDNSPQNVHIFEDGSAHSRSGRCLVIRRYTPLSKVFKNKQI